jgi:hypothetical protein
MVSETFLLRVPSSKLSWRLAGLASSSCRVGVSFPQLPAQKPVFQDNSLHRFLTVIYKRFGRYDLKKLGTGTLLRKN